MSILSLTIASCLLLESGSKTPALQNMSRSCDRGRQPEGRRYVLGASVAGGAAAGTAGGCACGGAAGACVPVAGPPATRGGGGRASAPPAEGHKRVVWGRLIGTARPTRWGGAEPAQSRRR